MRIAVVAHVRHSIGPPFMGGMEAHSWHLVRALAGRGHEVTLLASGDSAAALPPGVRLVPILDEHYDRRFPWHTHHGTDALNDHVDAGFATAMETLRDGAFDVVHNNSLHRFPPRLGRSARVAMLTSLHVPPFDTLRRAVHAAAAPWCRFTVTSRRQRAAWWGEAPPPEAAICHNGIDLDLWPYRDGGDGSAVWSGRITPTKGTHLAVEAAARAGIPLTIFGAIEHQDYFAERVRPFLGGGIRYGGHLPGRALAAELGRASVMLFTPLWDEPFGLSAVEAMATGLPVAAINGGAVREVVGPAGAIAETASGAALAAAMGRALEVPRRVPRERVERLFSLERMISRYETLYAQAIAGLSAPAPDAVYTRTELAIGATASGAVSLGA